jgi:hypothetical protein
MAGLVIAAAEPLGPRSTAFADLRDFGFVRIGGTPRMFIMDQFNGRFFTIDDSGRARLRINFAQF